MRSSQCEAFQTETTFVCGSDEILLDEDGKEKTVLRIKTICEFDATKLVILQYSFFTTLYTIYTAKLNVGPFAG